MISIIILLAGMYLVIGISSYNDMRTPKEIAVILLKFTGIILVFILLVWSSKFSIIDNIWTVIWSVVGLSVLVSSLIWLKNNFRQFMFITGKIVLALFIAIILILGVIYAPDMDGNSETRSNIGGDYHSIKEYFQP